MDFFAIEKTIGLLILLIPIIIIASFAVAIPFYYLQNKIKKKREWHTIIIMLIVPLIIYGIINIILDYSKGALFNLGQATNDLSALALYLIILVSGFIFYNIYTLIRTKRAIRITFQG